MVCHFYAKLIFNRIPEGYYGPDSLIPEHGKIKSDPAQSAKPLLLLSDPIILKPGIPGWRVSQPHFRQRIQGNLNQC